MKPTPDFSYEKNSGKNRIAGVDEAGRGPLCGPVVAAAVVFPDYEIDIPILITDSKKMSQKQRDAAATWIRDNTMWAIAISTPSEIDELNILWASMQAMERAVAGLEKAPEFCLIDGNRMPRNLKIPGDAIVRGDSKSLSIAAASILAKCERDRIMAELHIEYPQYGWDKNAGYGTRVHMDALDKYGVTVHHRKTFAPIKQRSEKCS